MKKMWEIRFVIHYNGSYNEDDIVRMEVPQSDNYTPNLWIEEIENNIKKYQEEGEDTIEATCKALDDTGNKWEFEDHNVGTVYVGI